MKCRGTESRQRIVKNYIIHPVAHVKLLNGQTKLSCTSDTLTDSYYCFDYVARSNPSDRGTFYCGSHAADDFLKLTQLSPLPLFNPLVTSGEGGGGSGGSSSKKWDPLAKQLNNAINMLVVCWDIVPGGVLANIQAQLIQYPNSTPFLSKLKAVNTIIGYDKSGRTLQQMIEGLREKNNVRNFQFHLINRELESEDIPSNFG
ncbi:hypothetical protein [Vibrio cholerae]|uniref:hypothetical protein n=1 Tax=Vibrio cholerae TaxID=666 RepID=UPI000892F3EC|nr:hypothetical protein [Vibrio cholerae]ELJ8444647.1 hypothetical protein [Vibrio cholerae]ELJ8520085.1 hypothetical protein [Vibrio cholerae]OFJ37563.1 hypothetical protein BFX35_17665 [Vibrio cholerae]HAS4580113.1 hypothetical protein [Vibrio cholerae]HDL9491566.1 hypothetical protein [Vibrio cholerae]